jgi:hypothetical protein
MEPHLGYHSRPSRIPTPFTLLNMHVETKLIWNKHLIGGYLMSSGVVIALLRVHRADIIVQVLSLGFASLPVLRKQ